MDGQRGRRERAGAGAVPTRRDLLRGGAGAVLGGVAAATGGRRAAARPARAQDPAAFTRPAAIVSWGFGVENPLAAARVDAFKAAYPSITLDVVPQTDDQTILAAAADGALPDLLWLDRFAIPFWAERGVLQPLTPFVQAGGYDTGRYYANALAESTYGGQLYGIPGGMDARVVYANLDALAEAGVDPAALDTGDWEGLAALGPRLLKAAGGTVERWGFDHKIQDGTIYAWGAANGARFMTEDGRQPTFNDPKAVETLAWGLAAYDAQGGYAALQAARGAWQGDEQFARGQVAVTMYESWMLGIVARVAPALNFRVLPLRLRGGAGLTGLVGGRAWCIPRGAKDPEAAWEFIRFLHTDETWLVGAYAVKAARQAAGQPYIPALTGSTTADRAQIDRVYEPIEPKFDEAVRLFPEVLAKSPNREVARSPVGKQLDDIMDAEAVEPALRTERPPQEALDAANLSAQEAVALAEAP